MNREDFQTHDFLYAFNNDSCRLRGRLFIRAFYTGRTWPSPGTAPDISNKLGSHSYLVTWKALFPDNFITPFQTANVLSVLLIAAAVGIAIAKMPRESKNQDLMITFFKASQDVLFTLVNWLIVVLPIGIFAFVASLAQEVSHGVSLGGLGTYFALLFPRTYPRCSRDPAFLMLNVQSS